MNILIAILFLITGSLGVLHPSFFYNTEKLSVEGIARNKRIWNRCGACLILLGIIDLAITLFSR